MPETVHVCSICQGPYMGFGNNAYPVNDGRCCDDCNSTTVIPARIRAMTSRTSPGKSGKLTKSH